MASGARTKTRTGATSTAAWDGERRGRSAPTGTAKEDLPVHLGRATLGQTATRRTSPLERATAGRKVGTRAAREALGRLRSGAGPRQRACLVALKRAGGARRANRAGLQLEKEAPCAVSVVTCLSARIVSSHRRLLGASTWGRAMLTASDADWTPAAPRSAAVVRSGPCGFLSVSGLRRSPGLGRGDRGGLGRSLPLDTPEDRCALRSQTLGASEWGSCVQICVVATLRRVEIWVEGDIPPQVFGSGPAWGLCLTESPGHHDVLTPGERSGIASGGPLRLRPLEEPSMWEARARPRRPH